MGSEKTQAFNSLQKFLASVWTVTVYALLWNYAGCTCFQFIMLIYESMRFLLINIPSFMAEDQWGDGTRKLNVAYVFSSELSVHFLQGYPTLFNLCIRELKLNVCLMLMNESQHQLKTLDNNTVFGLMFQCSTMCFYKHPTANIIYVCCEAVSEFLASLAMQNHKETGFPLISFSRFFLVMSRRIFISSARICKRSK